MRDLDGDGHFTGIGSDPLEDPVRLGRQPRSAVLEDMVPRPRAVEANDASLMLGSRLIIAGIRSR